MSATNPGVPVDLPEDPDEICIFLRHLGGFLLRGYLDQFPGKLVGGLVAMVELLGDVVQTSAQVGVPLVLFPSLLSVWGGQLLRSAGEATT